MPSGKGIEEWLKPISKYMDTHGGQQETIEPQVSQPPKILFVPPQSQPQEQPKTVQPVQPQPHVEEQGGGTLDVLSLTIESLNTNPYFIGMLMLMLNLGGRFLATELTPKQEQFLQSRWLRPLLFFIVIFVATRNIAVAFWFTLALFMILWILANEQSPFCIIPSWKPLENPEEKKATYESNMELMEQLHSLHHK